MARRRSRRRSGDIVTSLSALLAGLAAPVAAQDLSEGEYLGEIVILNTEDATGPVGNDTNPLTATGGKTPVNVSDIPQSVSVLGREQIETFDAKRTSEALRYTAGVTADVYGDDQDYDWLFVRGFQADQTGIYLDNAQNLSFAFGSFFIDPYTLERIEVLRGPSSALYGGSNPGGIINYVSKRPGGHVGEFTLDVNDAGTGWVGFDLGEDINDRQSYRFTGRLEAGDKYDDLNTGWRGTLAAGFKTELDTGTEITLLANLHKADEKHNGSTFLPYYGTVAGTTQFGYIDPNANFSDPDWDLYDREQATVSAIVEHQFDNGFTLTGIGRLGYANLNERYYYPYGYAGYALMPADAVGTLSLIAFEHETETRTAQADIRYYGTVDTGGVSHDLLFGLDARYYELDEIQASGFGTNTVVNPTAPGTPTTAVYQDATSKQRQIGLYFQDQLRWGGGWIGTVSLRHDWVETEQDGTGAFSRSDSESSGRAALAYQFDNGVTPYLSYSTFFNPLIVSPANGVTEPESGEQVELGLKWMPAGGPFYVTAALFQIDRRNVVSGVWPTFNQLGEVRMRGFELEGAYDFGNGLRLRGSATALDGTITSDSQAALVGKTPTLVPERELSLVAEYSVNGTPDRGLTVGAGLRHRGESFADDLNTLKVGSSTIFDAYASYVFDNDLAVNLTVTNLADTRYVTGCQTAYTCSYGSGREIALSLTKRF